jgi:hypothetical protein
MLITCQVKSGKGVSIAFNTPGVLSWKKEEGALWNMPIYEYECAMCGRISEFLE